MFETKSQHHLRVSYHCTTQNKYSYVSTGIKAPSRIRVIGDFPLILLRVAPVGGQTSLVGTATSLVCRPLVQEELPCAVDGFVGCVQLFLALE